MCIRDSGDTALDLLAEIVAPSDRPRAGHEDVHLDETARPGGARAEAVDDDAAGVKALEEAREGGLLVVRNRAIEEAVARLLEEADARPYDVRGDEKRDEGIKDCL